MQHPKLPTIVATMTLAGLMALGPTVVAGAAPTNDNDVAFAHGGNGSMGGTGINNGSGEDVVASGSDTRDPLGLLGFLFPS